MEYLYFLNLQYWYCIIYSLFGGACTYLDELRAEGVNVPFDGIQVEGTVEQSQTSWGIVSSMFEPFVAAGSLVWHSVSDIVSFLWGAYSVLAWSISAFLFFAILSAAAGLIYIRFRELYTYGTVPLEEKKNDPRYSRWEELLDYAKSKDPKLWRQAILEADRMLGDLLGNLGYGGVNTAEKIRRLPEDAFVTVPLAWEAHRVRNFVSAGTSDFILTQREAFRVMKLYEQVFEEFRYI